MKTQETVEEITATMQRISDTNDVEAIFYLGALDMLRDLWFDGGESADVAADKFYEIKETWLDKWIDERS